MDGNLRGECQIAFTFYCYYNLSVMELSKLRQSHLRLTIKVKSNIDPVTEKIESTIDFL